MRHENAVFGIVACSRCFTRYGGVGLGYLRIPMWVFIGYVHLYFLVISSRECMAFCVKEESVFIRFHSISLVIIIIIMIIIRSI